MPKFWRIVTILLCATIIALLMWRTPPKEFSQRLATTKTSQIHPSSYVVGVRTRQYDENGKVSYYLNAERINYFDQHAHPQPEIVIEQPHLTLFNHRKEASPWIISSKIALGREKSDELLLVDNVTIEQKQQTGHLTRLTTDELLIKPNSRYAETNKPVMIVDITGITNATGLKVFFDEERIELLSNVTGVYQP